MLRVLSRSFSLHLPEPALAVALLLGFVALSPRQATAQAPDGAKIHRPEAAPYEHLWLTFEGGAEPAKLFIGLRGGKSTTVWFLNGNVPGGVKKMGAFRVLIDGHDLTLAGDTLKGKIELRQVSVWAPMQVLGQLTLHIDSKESADGFTGTWSSVLGNGTKRGGGLSGFRLDEARIHKINAFPTDASWPSYHGPFGTNRGSDTKESLIDDLALARPLWRSEETTLSGWGTGVDSRYARRVTVGTLCGGTGSPVVADGRVYQFHYVPAGDPDPKQLEKALADFEKAYKRKPTPQEHDDLVDFARQFADMIVTCLDARTGAVLWRVTFPRFAANIQTHKWRGFNPTPVVFGPVIIANDYANNWVGLNALNGDVLWTINNGPKVEGDRGVPGAAKAGSLAILPSRGKEPVRAIDVKTGKVAWEQPGGRQQALVWGKPGAERVLLLGRENPTCHDAATGKLLWKMDEKLIGVSGSSALIEGDILVGHILPDSKKRGGFFQGWKLSDSGATKLWQDEYLPFDENLTVTLGKDRAYLAGQNELRCVALVSGKLLGKQVFDGKTHRIGSNQWLALVGDRLFLCPEGQHGSQSLLMLEADPKLGLIGSTWTPPSNHTTAYGVHSLAYPVVDGRLFLRGMDGLYCYDLRKAPSASKGK